MNRVGSWVDEAAGAAQLPSVFHSIYAFLLPQEHAQKSSLTRFALGNLQNIAHAVTWFLLVGLVVYGSSLSRRRNQPGDLTLNADGVHQRMAHD
jgi:hypothetical protein